MHQQLYWLTGVQGDHVPRFRVPLLRPRAVVIGILCITNHLCGVSLYSHWHIEHGSFFFVASCLLLFTLYCAVSSVGKPSHPLPLSRNHLLGDTSGGFIFQTWVPFFLYRRTLHVCIELCSLIGELLKKRIYLPVQLTRQQRWQVNLQHSIWHIPRRYLNGLALK